MRLSIVMPVHNAAGFLGATLASAAAQSHEDLEIILVDDGSSDGSWEIAAAFVVAEPRARCERLDHGGAPRARNRGLERATGDFVLFLDADDLISPDLGAALLAALAAAPPRSFAVAPWQRLVLRDGAWQPAPARVPPAPGGDPLAGWLAQSYVPTSGVLWPTALVRELGGWDPELTINQDGDLAMRALVAGAHMVRAAGGLLSYRRHGPSRRSVSSGRAEADVRSQVRVLEKVEAGLVARGDLARYRPWLGRAFHEVARVAFAEGHVGLGRQCARRAEALAGRDAVGGSWLHRGLVRLAGLERKERLAAALALVGIGRRRRRRVGP